jgi:hypothetical protein
MAQLVSAPDFTAGGQKLRLHHTLESAEFGRQRSPQIDLHPHACGDGRTLCCLDQLRFRASE